MAVYPKMNLSPEATPWGKRIQSDVESVIGALNLADSNNLNGNKGQNATLNGLSAQIAALQLVTDQLTVNTNTLLGIAGVQYSEWTAGATATGTGFIFSPTSVVINSPTGRIEIAFGGSLNGGQGYFCYGVETSSGTVIVDRATVQANPAQRVAVTGGASFSPSGYKSVIINVPANTNLVVSLELFSGLAGTYFLGGSIQARVAP